MAARVQSLTKEQLHLDALPPETQNAFLFLAEHANWLESDGWYLAGGTALALHVGHRASVDLDFFTERSSFQETDVERLLMATKKWQTTLREDGTLFGALDGAKASFIAYPFFRPSRRKGKFGMVTMLLPEDIAAMKIIAISQRGKKRDFIDLYWYCTNREPLQELVLRAIRQYPGQEQNLPHILKSLVFFVDAETDPMPELFFNVTWERVKTYFTMNIPKVLAMLT